MATPSLIIGVALGGAGGAVMRWWLNERVQAAVQKHELHTQLPIGILFANVLGSLLIGLLFVLFAERSPQLDPAWRALLITGFLGALTTFSTFSLDTLLLMQRGEFATAALNIILNVSVCLFATWAGMSVARHVF